jgi:catalase
MMSKDKKMNSGKQNQEKDFNPNQDSQAAKGGELHQITKGDHPALTTNQGIPVSDNQNSLKANPHGTKTICTPEDHARLIDLVER